jgi:hypothetical protein
MGKTLGEANGQFLMGKNIITPTDPLQDQIRRYREEKDAAELAEKFSTIDKEKQKEIEEKLSKLECLPLGNKIIMLPYPVNPYRRVLTAKGIVTDTGGAFLNPDTGEWDKEKELVACAKIIEVGPDCKYLEIGDDVFYDTRTIYPFPLFNLGYMLTSEPQILGVLNEGLKNRFKM